MKSEIGDLRETKFDQAEIQRCPICNSSGKLMQELANVEARVWSWRVGCTNRDIFKDNARDLAAFVLDTLPCALSFSSYNADRYCVFTTRKEAIKFWNSLKLES